jgi:hypothetical protein
LKPFDAKGDRRRVGDIWLPGSGLTVYNVKKARSFFYDGVLALAAQSREAEGHRHTIPELTCTSIRDDIFPIIRSNPT